MTERERKQLRRAIADITGGDQHFDRGYRALLKLAGMRSPAFDALDGAKAISVLDVARGPERTFRCIDPRPVGSGP